MAIRDEIGRPWDVLYRLSVAIRCGATGPGVPFTVHVRNSNRPGILVLARLKAL